MKTTRKKTCGRGQGYTKILSPVNQEFYQPSNSKDQKIIEDRLMRSVAAAAQRRIDFEKEKAKASRHVSFIPVKI